MLQRNVLVFIAQSVFDVFLIVEHLNKHIKKTDGDLIVNNGVYDYPEKQKEYFKKFKLDKYLNGGLK